MNGKDYTLFNVIFAILLFGLLGWSFIVDPSNSLSCQVQEATGAYCSSCGLTRDFHSFTHFNFYSAINPISIYVFGWFLVQLAIRLILISLSKRNSVAYILYDAVFAIATGILVFGQFWI